MPDELPSGDKAVYIFLEMIALGFALEAVSAFVNNKPRGVGVGSLVLAVVFFIAGIKWPQIKLRVGTRFATGMDRIANDSRYRSGLALLLIGFFCVYVIVYLHSLRNDLDMYVIPRDITDKQASDIQEFLSHHEPYAITVKVNPVDREAREYAGQVLNALKRAGWDADFSTSSDQPYPGGEGMCIQEEGVNSRPKQKDPVRILQQAFTVAHVEVGCTGGEGAGEYKLFILVGPRPIKVGDTEPALSKLGRWIQDLGQP